MKKYPNGTAGKTSNRWSVADTTSGPSRKMIKLTPWIETDCTTEAPPVLESGKWKLKPQLSDGLSEESFVQQFTHQFATKGVVKSPIAKLLNHPFQTAIVDNFLSESSLMPKLVEEMESLEWTRKQMDLYEFYQTTDLANVQSPHLVEFYNFLNADVRCWMETLTGMKFQKISASCSMYNCGDFLLTHDDLLTDRLIAFVYYLSPWKGQEQWTASMGGALELFQTDKDGQPNYPVKKKIYPSNNQFVFFKVEKKSFHQVGEVLSKEFPRLTINGWFHGYADNKDFDSEAVRVKKPNVPVFKTPIASELKLDAYINRMYLKDAIKKSVQKQIEENSEAALGDFLFGNIHEKVSKELENKALKWITKGPSNQQNYDYLITDELPKDSTIKKLTDLLMSKMMFKLLHEYTELDLHGAAAKHPQCYVELQRWKGGCYTLIGDPSTYSSDTLDLILYFGCNDNVGVITYLTPEEEQAEGRSTTSSENEADPVLLTIYPQNNFLNIVYRSEGTARFLKYSSKATVMKTEFNYILFCSYKE